VDWAAFGLVPATARPAIPVGPQSVAAILDEWLAADPAREALVDRRSRYTFLELDRAVNRAAHGLLAIGVRPFDRVAVSVPNSNELVIAFLAVMRLSAIWVGINRVLAPPEKAYILEDSGATLFFGDADMVAQVELRRPQLTKLERLITALPAADNDARPAVEIDPFAPAAIAYTSGTTGFPKGAVHSQHNLLLPGAVSRWRKEHSEGTRHAGVLPLTILNLMVLGPLLAFEAGCAVVMVDKIDGAGLAEWVRKERLGHFAGVPTILHDLLTAKGVDPKDLATLRRPLVGGADTPESFQTLYRERFGGEVTIGYGMTEAPTAVTMTDGSRPPAPGLCGKALPQVEIAIVDESEQRLPPGQVGEICVLPQAHGPWGGVYTPMLGYWNKPEATRAVLRSGMFKSGDLGELDGDGTLTIRGRKNDLILRGGANVYPAEVERVLMQDPRVAACAVLGKADLRLGERVVAVVQLKDGATASSEELRAHCAEALARYKVPEQWIFVDQFPRNAMGKIIKRQLEPLLEPG
jgi:acyl-CoA synthetase (AMP-forming)/AMP-acid ligase II